MKISELIKKLKEVQEKEGDLDIVGYSDEFGEVYEFTGERGFLEVADKEYVPRYGSEDYDENDYRFVDYPVRNKELFKKLSKRFLVIC